MPPVDEENAGRGAGDADLAPELVELGGLGAALPARADPPLSAALTESVLAASVLAAAVLAVAVFGMLVAEVGALAGVGASEPSLLPDAAPVTPPAPALAGTADDPAGLWLD